MRLWISVSVGLLALAGQAPAQQVARTTEPELVDRIVAIVGDSAIFHNQLGEHILRLQATGVQVPPDSASQEQFRVQALNDLVTQTLLVQAASRDTLITVFEDRLEADLQSYWDNQLSAFGSEAALRRELALVGMTPAQYRESTRTELRNQQLIEQYVDLQRQTLRIPPVEEALIREVFERDRDLFGSRPATVSFRQVLLVPEPSDSARAIARAEATRILGLLRDGQDFEELARRFSDDPGSQQEGGDLGWLRTGQSVREFDQVLFSLQRGQTSGVVETVFGAHIIRLERIRGAERNARHILIAAEIGPADIDRTRARAQEIREAVASGTLITEFENEGEETGLPPMMEHPIDQLGQLPGGYATELRGAQEGDILGPIEISLSPERSAFAVVRVTGVREAGEYTYEDARDVIRANLRDEFFRNRLVEKLRAETYVEIRL